MSNKRFVGIDWGGVEHAVCVIDDDGDVVKSLTVKHTAAGIAELRRTLRRLGSPESMPVSVERPSGLLIDSLVEAGHPVVPIHPNALKACRPRYRAAGGKSDRGDAYILADVLRTDGHRLTPLRPLSDEVRALRSMVRGRDDLVAQRVATANQLRAVLDSFWPGAAAIFADIDSAIALAFLDRYPTPGSARALGPKRLAAFLARNGYCGRRKPQDLLERLRSAPVGLAGDMEAEAKGGLVRTFVSVLQRLVTEIRKLSSAIEHAVAQLRRGRVVMSFPRAGRINAAQILAELGDDPARFPTDDQLAAEAGVAPVTYASGKQRGVHFRWACNKRLRRAITTFADNSRHSSAWAKAVYDRARSRGCDHPHATRILARAWVRVLWRCWTNGAVYDVRRHRAARPHLAEGALAAWGAVG